MRVVEGIRRHVGVIREKVLEKLVAASAPKEGIENARLVLENVVKDVSVAAHGLTMDALSLIKCNLVDLLPSLSPSLTRKTVDDAAKEANYTEREYEVEEEEEHEDSKLEEDESMHSQTNPKNSKGPYITPTSSLFASLKPLSRL